MIMIAYDGSPSAVTAIKQAAVLMPGHPAAVLATCDPGMEPVAAQLAADGAALAHEVGIDANPRVCRRHGTVAETILQAAGVLRCHAIVIGSSRGGHADGPRVCDEVVRQARMPVLVISDSELSRHASEPADGLGVAA
jgi:nucleotide-binding universal stress UspA family protein